MIGKTESFFKKFNDRQFLLLSYKLSYDVLFLLIVAFVTALFLEAVLPGMVSHNNGFLTISFLIFGSIWSVTTLGKKLGIEFRNNRKHHLFPFIMAGSFILIGNSLLKFSLWENLIITTVTLFIFFILYHTLFPAKK